MVRWGGAGDVRQERGLRRGARTHVLCAGKRMRRLCGADIPRRANGIECRTSPEESLSDDDIGPLRLHSYTASMFQFDP